MSQLTNCNKAVLVLSSVLMMGGGALVGMSVQQDDYETSEAASSLSSPPDLYIGGIIGGSVGLALQITALAAGMGFSYVRQRVRQLNIFNNPEQTPILNAGLLEAPQEQKEELQSYNRQPG